MPDSIAVVCPHRRVSGARRPQRGASGALYDTISFADLEADVARIANGLVAWGVPKGTRLALLVKPGIEFVTLVFALLRAGMVIVLVDPGLGRRNLVRCLSEAEPEGFVAISTAQLVRAVLRRKFPRARWNVTVGRRWLWGGKTLDELQIAGGQQRCSSTSALSTLTPVTSADDPAAIIFTSGSTGPPKGVLYTQRMFDTQVGEIQSTYGIEPGGIDLACFPLFALFNAAMGVTTVLPEMDFSRPAAADPEKLLAAANDWQVTSSFCIAGSVARAERSLPPNGQADSIAAADIFMRCAGASGCAAQHARLCRQRAKMHTPYGATECLPVSTIEAAEVLGETAARTDQGAGVCVGRKFDSIDWRVIRITDDPIATVDDAGRIAAGRNWRADRSWTAGFAEVCHEVRSKRPIEDRRSERCLASHGRRRLLRRAQAASGIAGGSRSGWKRSMATPFTECVEAVVNTHPDVRRSRH